MRPMTAPSRSAFLSTASPMTTKTFDRFSQFIRKELGINITEAKKTMLQARLQKRMRLLGIESFEAYYDYVFSPEGLTGETFAMIDAITTNKTDFFREPKHFEHLTNVVLPEILQRRSSGNTVRFWSAGCATGEEPYTLAMVLCDYMILRQTFDFSIMASDISTQVLKKGVAGIYEHEKIEPVPMPMRKRYLLKSKDKTSSLVRIVPELRAKVNFRRINLMERDLDIRESYDVVFFRNVIIYFDRPTQQRVIRGICRHIRPGGYIFMGHSETLNGLDLPLTPTVSTVYRRN